MIRKKYLEMRIKEAGDELKELEAKIGYNPYPSRPNVVLPQQPAMDTMSVAARSEFTDATKVTDNTEDEKAASKEERKANEGQVTSNDIDDCPSTGFSTNSKPFIYNPNYGQEIDDGLMGGKKKRGPATKQPESTFPPLQNCTNEADIANDQPKVGSNDNS